MEENIKSDSKETLVVKKELSTCTNKNIASLALVFFNTG
jgi:hypothetical protein